MKLLFIRSTRGFSGAEIYTQRLVSALNKHGEDAQILTNYRNFLIKSKADHIPCSFIFMPIPEIATKKNFLIAIVLFFYMIIVYIAKIKQLEGCKKFDVIILESMTEKLFFSPYLKLLGYRVIWIEHGPVFKTNRFNLIKYLYVYKTKWVNRIITVSDDTKKDLLGGGVFRNKVIAIYIGINIFKNIIIKKIIGKNRPFIVGYIGCITHGKGIIEFVHVATKLVIQKIPVKFILIGDGPELDRIKDCTNKMGLSNKFLFTGNIDTVWKYGKTMDIFYFPTHQEGLSLALLEALAYGKLAIARDVGGNRELVIDKKTGFLFKSNEEGERILEGVITGKISTAGIREAAYAHLRKNFLMEKQVKKFMEVFRG